LLEDRNCEVDGAADHVAPVLSARSTAVRTARAVSIPPRSFRELVADHGLEQVVEPVGNVNCGVPLAVPIWYAFEPSRGISIVTDSDSRKGRAIQSAGRFGMVVQHETVPYRFVSVEGPVTEARPMDPELDLKPLAQRYLGTHLGDLYTAAMSGLGPTTFVYTMLHRGGSLNSVGSGRVQPRDSRSAWYLAVTASTACMCAAAISGLDASARRFASFVL
jgi:Pyridoxamine 5'-phosphate oxidase